MQDYPFGSILTWRLNKENDNDIKFETYKFIQDFSRERSHNEPANLNGITSLNLVLDGQQRLTALNIGLRGSYTYESRYKTKTKKLYLNLISDIENAIDNTYNLKYEFDFHEANPTHEEKLWFEVGKVLDFRNKNAEDFKKHHTKWIDENCVSEKHDKAKETLVSSIIAFVLQMQSKSSRQTPRTMKKFSIFSLEQMTVG